MTSVQPDPSPPQRSAPTPAATVSAASEPWHKKLGAKVALRDRVPGVVKRMVDREALERRRKPALWGTLRRLDGFSVPYAEGRGTPVDRHYIEAFLDDHRQLITGSAMEIHDPGYLLRFGHDLTTTDAVDIRTDNPSATIVADLCQVDALPEQAFDCAVVTQTVHLVPDMVTAMANLRRCLKPGGTLLLTGPVTSPLAVDLPTDAWRFTPLGLQHLAEGCAQPGDEIEVTGLGNRVSSVAFLLGLAVEDLSDSDLEPCDPLCPLIAALRLRRSP